MEKIINLQPLKNLPYNAGVLRSNRDNYIVTRFSLKLSSITDVIPEFCS